MQTDRQGSAWLSWEKFLNPSKLKQNLVEASIFLTAYEILRSSIEVRLRGFFSFDAVEGTEGAAAYNRNVAVLHPRDPFHASCLWFKQNGVLNDGDIEVISSIRRHRNAIAHELPSFIARDERRVECELLVQLTAVVSRIDRWWIREYEPPFDENLEEMDLSVMPDEKVHSGNMIMLDLILSLLDGDESLLRELHTAVLNLALRHGDESKAETADIEQLFTQLAREWEDATRCTSSLTEMVIHPAYQRIIGLGPAALPMIFRELSRNPDHWFWALTAITGEDPVPPAARGKLSEMAEAWLQWGTTRGFVAAARTPSRP